MDCPKQSAVASDLPEDAMVDILARIPARSLCRSKCVAKAWRDVIQDPFHRKRLPQTLQGFFSIARDNYNERHISYDYVSLLAGSAPPHMDPSLSFLTKLPGFKRRLTFLDSCNGLLLFEHLQESLGYVVCNPTTKQWVAVPRYGPPPSLIIGTIGPMYLAFDPAISSHFHVVQFVWAWKRKEFEEEGFVVDSDDDGEEANGGYLLDYHHQEHDNDDDDDDYDDDNDYEDDEEDKCFASVNVYSSESGQWIHIESDWYKHNLKGWYCLGSRCAVLNDLLHFVIFDKDQIAAVDVQGVTQKIIPVPITDGRNCRPVYRFIAQSQGFLHYINEVADAQLYIWVLEDYDTQKWVLKHSVSLELFGIMNHRQSCRCKKEYSVVAMHPDANVLFIVHNRNRKLISYDMDHKLVSVIQTYTSTVDAVVPYVPCFLESPALTNKL